MLRVRVFDSLAAELTFRDDSNHSLMLHHYFTLAISQGEVLAIVRSAFGEKHLARH